MLQAALAYGLPIDQSAQIRGWPSATSPVIKDGVNRYTPGTSLRALAGGTSTFQHGGLKSLDAQTDSSQAVSGTKTYDAFGATASSTGSWQGQSGFGGGFGYQPDSDTGLQLLGHRYYDPTTGRFLSRDPAKDGLNWYAYCLNDPVNGVDPDGREVTALAVAGGLAIADGPLPIGDLIAPGILATLGTVQVIKLLQNANTDEAEEDTTGSKSDEAGLGICPWPDDEVPSTDSPPPGWSRGGPDENNTNPDEPGLSIRPDLNHPPPIGPHWDIIRKGIGKIRVPPGPWKP